MMMSTQLECGECGGGATGEPPPAQAVVDLDTHGRIVAFNRAAERVLGPLVVGAMGLDALTRGPGRAWQLTVAGDADGRTLSRLTPLPSPELLAAATAGVAARGISHDLNNLFTCILAAATMRDRRGDGERDLAAIRQAVIRGAELLALLRDLTAEAPPAAGTREVLECCGHLLARVGARSGVEVEVRSVQAWVAMPARDLQQVVINLGLNAIDAMTAGGGRLELAAVVRGREVDVTVADAGPGIPSSQVEGLFEPGCTTKLGHSGVGLAVVRELVQRAAGRIDVETEVGRGTRFTVTLPAGEGGAP